MKREKIIKWVTRGIALFFALLLILTSVLYVASAQETATIDYADAFGDGNILFVDSNGSESNDGLTPEAPLNSIQLALDYLGAGGGTIVIVDYIPLGEKALAWPAHAKDGMQRVTITGLDEESTLSWNRSLNPNGPVTLEYLNIIVDKAYAYLNARGHELILGKGLNVTKGEGINCLMCIRGGGDTNMDIEGDTNIIVHSGSYSSFCGGSRNGYIHGDTHITIYGGTFSSLHGGNNNGSEEDAKNIKNVLGNTYITIYGGTFNSMRGHDINSLVEGKRYLDVSGYANANPAWFQHFDEVKEYDPNLVSENPEIKIIADGSFINGYTDGTFKPQNQITRAETMTIVSRLLANDEDIKGKYTLSYDDVKEDAWYYSNIAYLDALGVIDFLNLRNKISPTKPITRQEVCRLVYNLGGITAIKINAADFSDLTARTYNEAIYALAASGIVNGYTDGTFKPLGTITRAEFVTIIDRFLGRNAVVENVDSANKFNDISSHWAKNYIVAASSGKAVGGKEIWNISKDAGAKFAISEKASTAEEYIKELKTASASLSTDAIQEGIELIADKRIAEIRNTKTTLEIPENATVYYVSADGNDDNDGLTPETAVKTLSKVNRLGAKIGSYVLFRRGDIFRGSLTTRPGVTYSAYGEGEKPRIYGWDKNSAEPALWSKTDAPNVWVYAEEVAQDVGNIIFDGKTHTRKVIRSEEKDGRKLDYRAGREFNDYHDLVDDLTFFHDIKGDKKVYLVCKAGNPGEVYDEIEMAKKVHIIQNGETNNVRVDNLCVMYGGAHGISAGNCKGLTVTNCEFAWIGGSIQAEIGAYNRTWPTPYGNAIEVFGQAVDYTVDNCYIRQVYDAGVTHQGSSSGNVAVSNVNYTNNVIEKCVYAIEIFYGEAPEGSNLTRSMDGVYIKNNLLRMGGGFGHEQRPDTGVTALIRNGKILNNTTNYIVDNNIFDRSKTRIITAAADGGSKAVYTGNLYVQVLGQSFCSRYGKTYTASSDIKRNLEFFPEEKDGIFVLVEEFGY